MHRFPILLLCCLASGASAKDVRRTDAPEVTTKGCEWAGPGFVKLEGSSTCVKVGGSVRADYSTKR